MRKIINVWIQLFYAMPIRTTYSFMNHKSFDSALAVISYLNATGDTLSRDVCNALGLPSSKCYISHLKERIECISSCLCSQNENPKTNDKIGLHNSPCQTVIAAHIEALRSDIFTTSDITNKLSVPRSTLSKAISTLLKEGKIEFVAQEQRPKVYRRIPTVKTNFLETYIKAHALTEDDDNSIQSKRLLPVYVNRAYCGMSKPIIVISEMVVQFANRSGVSFPSTSDLFPEERQSIENLVLLVFNSGRDFRVVRRKLTEEITFSETTRKVLSKLSNENRRNRLVKKYCLPESLSNLLSTEQGLVIFYESALQTLGGDICKKTVYHIIPSILAQIEKDVASIQMDTRNNTSSSSTLKTNQPFSVNEEQVVESSIKKIVACMDTPFKRVNVKKLYTQLVQEFQRQYYRE